MSETPPSSWRDLVPAAREQSDGRPLALGVELRQRTAAEEAHWAPRRVETVTPRGLAKRQDDLTVGLRPLTRGTGGGWVKADASWDAVRRHPDRWAPAHARWFRELYSIAHDVRATGPFASVSEWLTLETAGSGLLWPHLARASALGIPLVATDRRQTVRLAAGATVEVEIAPAAGGALRVRGRVSIDGEALDTATVRAIADSGLYAFAVHRDPVPIVLAPATISAPVAALLAAPRGIVVPAGEAEEFLRDAYPTLARSAPISAAGGVSLPAPARAALRLAAAFGPGDRVAYRFEWSVPGLPVTPFTNPPGHDPSAEDEVRGRVQQGWADAAALPFAAAATLHDADVAEFVSRVLPAIDGIDGVRIETTGSRRDYHELAGDPAIRVTTVESTDPDWFTLGVIVTIDGRTIPFGSLFTALARGRRRLMLSDGAHFSLAHPALARLKELLEEASALDEWETGPRIARTQLALWADFEDLADQSEPARAWRALVDGLRDADGVAQAELPAGLRTELRPYQRDGFSWLMFLWRHRLGGILADDMGLGKTLQALTLIAAAVEAGEQRPFLVVAPTSVLPTWSEEAAQSVPGLRVRSVGTTAASSGVPLATAAADADVIVTSYAVLRLDQSEFAGVEWAGVVLDEAQFVKNPRTKLHRAVAELRADVVFALTGTPMENSLTDLWALLSLTAPGLFPSARRFRDEYVMPIEKGKVPDNAESGSYRARRLERLRSRIRPLVLRRTKELVAPELPPKQEQDLHVELSPAHRARYDAVLQRERQKVLGLLDDLDRNRFIVFRSLTLLRMLSLAPALLDERDAKLGSSKLDALLEHVAELATEGHRALVFSQFTSFLALAAARLDAAGIAYEELDGSTPRRAEVIGSFRTGDAPVFLISLKAGGFGLTLTEADYVFLLDPWWNPAAEAQAIDRTHRIGQQRNVFVYRLLSTGTIEEKVRALQARKARLVHAVMDDGDLFARSLTADDIRGLLDA